MHAVAAVLPLLLLATPAAPPEHGEIYVLAINGGGDRLDNFASHLAHLHQLVDVLATAGVPKSHITVLASDGPDPARDLATREPDPEHAWLLQGTDLDPLLRDLTVYEDSRVPGIDLRPATAVSLKRAIGELATRLHAGDTLLLYVTDHGTQSHRDPTDNRITLWGPHEGISVRQLGAALGRLPAGVRVLSLMSQCFSGGFAYLHEPRERRRRPSGATCGYFSSTPDRPAYGCYPEVRGQKAVGHSFEFLSALARTWRFPAAHADVLVNDDTPDIPLRSSDVYLSELLGRHAPSQAGEAAFVDSLLGPTLATSAYAEKRALIDRIAARFSLSRPPSVVALEQELDSLSGFLDRLDAQAHTWETALADFNQSAVDRFLGTHTSWKPQIEHAALSGLAPRERRDRTTAFLRELFASIASDSDRLAQANRLTNGLSETDEIVYRTEIRVAALLRIRFLLTSIAGREWAKRRPPEAEAVTALERCEDLALPARLAPSPASGKPTAPKLPPVAQDERTAAGLRPGWIGITFVPLSPARRRRLHQAAGAATVTAVMPGSPAAEAGLRPGDVLQGPPGRSFSDSRDVRPTIAAALPGTKLPLEIVRAGNRLVVTTVVREAPAAKK